METGLSVAGVNERLRAARRKTGAVSSRELARLVAQENRDEQIGLPSSGGGAAAATTPAAPRAGRRTMMAMTILAAAALAATMAVQQTSTEPPATDPLLGKILAERTLADWHRDLRSEKRDPTWAASMEATLSGMYAAVPNLSANGNQLRVTCGRTICEIATPWPKGLTRRQEAKLSEDLQSLALNKKVRALGFTDKDGAASFGETFVAYWLRDRD